MAAITKELFTKHEICRAAASRNFVEKIRHMPGICQAYREICQAYGMPGICWAYILFVGRHRRTSRPPWTARCCAKGVSVNGCGVVLGPLPTAYPPPTPDGGTCTIWHCGGGKQPSICLAYANACGSHTWAGRPGPPVRAGGRYVLGSGPNTTPQSFTEKPLAQGRAVQGGREVRR